MDILISHKTEYLYEEPSPHSIQVLRLTPRSHAGQRISRWSVSGNGRRDLPEVEDAFGNVMHTLTVSEPHDRVRILVSGEVYTSDTGGVISETFETQPTMVYLRETDLTEPDEAIQDLAAPLAGAAAKDSLDAAHQLMKAVHEAVRYEVCETTVGTTAAEALAAGTGVCQDHAHVLIAAARTLGLPARYVSGYLAAGSGDETYEASHAWAEILIESLGWVGFDAANCLCPTERYVRLAHGLDYHGAAPVIGVKRGGGPEDLKVSVQVRPAGWQGQSQSQSQSQGSGGASQ